MRLVDQGWKAELLDCAQAADGPITIVCPFVKQATLDGFLRAISPAHEVRLLTRFNLRDAAAGATDLAALRQILDRGGPVRGVYGLHAKVYVFGTVRAVVTSANLTARGVGKNKEFGCVSGQADFVGSCAQYLSSAARGDFGHGWRAIPLWNGGFRSCGPAGSRVGLDTRFAQNPVRVVDAVV